MKYICIYFFPFVAGQYSISKMQFDLRKITDINGLYEKKVLGKVFFKGKRVFCERSNEVIQYYSLKRTCLSANLNLEKACRTPKVQAHPLTSHKNMKNSIIHSTGCISSAVVCTVALAQQSLPRLTPTLSWSS